MTLTTRYPLFSLTASEAAAPRERLAFAMASLCSFACAKSSPWVIGSVLAILPVLWSTITSEKLSPFIVYTESCSLPSSTSYFAEIGLPSLALAVSPRSSGILAPFSAFSSSACSLALSSDVCAQLVGAANTNAAANAAMIPIIFIGEPPVLSGTVLRVSAVVPSSSDVAALTRVTLRHTRQSVWLPLRRSPQDGRSSAHPPFSRRSTNDQA